MTVAKAAGTRGAKAGGRPEAGAAQAVAVEPAARSAALVFSVPVRVTGPNIREHHFARARRVEKERQFTYWALIGAYGGGWKKKLGPAPFVVTLTRIGPRDLDTDNVQGACKSIRDQVAGELGYGDSPKDPISWAYAQERGKSYAVRVAIASSGGRP